MIFEGEGDKENVDESSVEKSQIVCESICSPQGNWQADIIDSSMHSHHGHSMSKKTNMKACNKSGFQVKHSRYGKEPYVAERLWEPEVKKIRSIIGGLQEEDYKPCSIL